MVGRCSHRSDLTPRRGGLMTNWCPSSIIVSTLPTPLGLLNGSILLVAPLFPPSCSLSLSSNISFFPFSLYRVSNNPPPTPTHPDHSVCLCRGRHRGSLIALYCHEVKFITLIAPTHTAYFEPAEIRFCIYQAGIETASRSAGTEGEITSCGRRSEGARREQTPIVMHQLGE